MRLIGLNLHLIRLFEKGVPQRGNLCKRLAGDSFNLHFNWSTDQRFVRRILDRVRIRSQGRFARAALQKQVTQLDVDKKSGGIHFRRLLKRLFRSGIVRPIRIKFFDAMEIEGGSRIRRGDERSLVNEEIPETRRRGSLPKRAPISESARRKE
jgi:hypothetical protein